MVDVRTYEEIMKRNLFLLPSDMDTREGTLAHIVMSVTAMCVAQLYEELKIVEENAYGKTAVGELLDRTVANLGLARLGKSNAVVKIECEEGFLVGDKFTAGELTYEITGINDGYYSALCTTAGSVGNSYIGEVLPVNNSGIGGARITEIIAAGCDEEDDEHLRKRYFDRLYCPVCTGNVSYYKEAIHSIAGVGGIKIVPAAEKAGEVKVVITNSDYEPASDALISYVKEYLDPKEVSGQGYGAVPIGHYVEVETVEKIDIALEIEINGGVGQGGFLRYARTDLPKILKGLNKNWDANKNIVIWNRIIEDYFFSLEGVEDVNIISINGATNRLILGENQIVGDLTINGA